MFKVSRLSAFPYAVYLNQLAQARFVWPDEDALVMLILIKPATLLERNKYRAVVYSYKTRKLLHACSHWRGTRLQTSQELVRELEATMRTSRIVNRTAKCLYRYKYQGRRVPANLPSLDEL
jgi:hypothetical protein